MNDTQKSALLITVFAGCVCLVMIGFFYFMLGRAQIAKYENLEQRYQRELSEKKGELNRIQTQLAMKDELDRQAEMIEKFTRRLPSSPDAPGFLNALVMILGTTGIVQEEVKPAGTVKQTLYTEIPYTVKAYGHYHALGQFLSLIEQNADRFMRVKHITIKNNPDRPSMHPVEMEIATFMFNEKAGS